MHSWSVLVTPGSALCRYHWDHNHLTRLKELESSGTVTVNRLSQALSEHGLLGEVAPGRLRWPHLRSGEKEEGERGVGGQERGRPAAEAVAVSCPSHHPGS